MKKLGTFLIGLALLTGCGNGMPEDIIQPEQMEDILYDYHLSMGISSHYKTNNNYQREAFKKYVFMKHQVTEAQFDSSMVWYTRNAQELATIYANLDKRYSREHLHLETLLESRQGGMNVSLSGDTVDVWGKGDIYWMTESPLSNQVLLEIFTDTTYHERDAFLWSIDYHFFSKGTAVMGLNVTYENDSVLAETRQVTESGRHTIYLRPDFGSQIRSINGFVYLTKDSVEQTNVLLHNISLTRYHQTANDSEAVAEPAQAEEVSKKDSKASFDRKKREMETIQIAQ